MINKKSHTPNYNNSIVIKPWGEEYVIFRNKKKISITYLKIKKGQSTSLHCHPKKKTGFLILSGKAEVQLGIYKKNTFTYKPMSILVLRAGLFHKIKASKYQDLYALEIENPYIKKDLVRMEDVYGRKNKDYESLSKTKKITKKNTVFKLPTLNHKHIYNLNVASACLKINFTSTGSLPLPIYKNIKSPPITYLLYFYLSTSNRNLKHCLNLISHRKSFLK